MRASLIPHPQGAPSPVAGIVVGVARDMARLILDYQLTGDIAGLLLPEPAARTRTDELWRHCCFEAFLRPLSGNAYVELNLSPSTQWAAYRFADYRQDMEPIEMPAPSIRTGTGSALLTVFASIDLAGVLPADESWQTGLSAVIEERDGSKGYWALAHPAGQPDFHHRHCFTLELPSAKQR